MPKNFQYNISSETMKYLAFDLEIAFDFSNISADEFPPNDGELVMLEGEPFHYSAPTHEFIASDGALSAEDVHWAYQGNDWKRFRPLGITCAAAASPDGGLWNWHAQSKEGAFAPSMLKEQCQHIVKMLLALSADRYTLLTWNGLGFDFDILAEESGMYKECKALALNQIDMMFHFLCSNGFPLGLDAAAKGMGLPGKPKGMTGAKAPELWANGEYHRVLDYVSWDVKNTLAVAEAVDNAGRLNWTSRSGWPNTWDCPRWLTVKEAVDLPEPDTSWMDYPWPRSKFFGWTERNPGGIPDGP
jgi:hypothetical protein